MRNGKVMIGIIILLLFHISSISCAVRMGRQHEPPQTQSPISTRSQRIRAMWKKFDDLLVQGKIEEAIQEADRLISLYPEYATGYNNRATAHWILERHDAAIQDFNTAITLNPRDTSFYHNRGWLYLNTDRIDTAIADFETIIRIEPTKPGGYDSLGWAYKKKGLHEQALSYFDKAVALAPESHQYRNGRAQTYASQGKFDLALTDINKYIEGNQKVSPAYSRRAYYHWMLGNYDLSIQDANIEIASFPKDSEAHSVRSLSRWVLGNKEQAVLDMKKAVELKSESPIEYLYLGYYSHEQGQRDEAHKHFSRAMELDLQAIEHFERLQNLAKASKTREFYGKITAAAKIYKQQNQPAHDYQIREEEAMGKDFVPVETVLLIESIEIRPNPIPPGGDFEIRVKCLITNPMAKDKKAEIRFDYKILKQDKTIKEKTQQLSIPVGKSAVLKSNLVAGKTPGVYKIQVMLFYKDKITGESAVLAIE